MPINERRAIVQLEERMAVVIPLEKIGTVVVPLEKKTGLHYMKHAEKDCVT